MQRKMTGLFAALVAFGAFALVPAISSAHGLLDTSGGVTTTTAVGSKIVAYNEAGTFVKFIGTGGGLTIECNEVTLTGTVHANPHTPGGAVEGTIEDAFFRGTTVENETAKTACKSNLGPATITVPGMTNEPAPKTRHWCIKSTPETDNFVVDPRSCTEPSGGEFTFLVHTGGITCGYSRTASLAGHLKTTGGGVNHEAATLTLNAGQTMTKHVGGILCPPSGELSEFKFEMFTDTDVTPGTYRHAASVADPIWIT